MDSTKIVKALAELRKEKERKFDQTIDLIINLKNIDMRKESVSLFVPVPHKIKEVKVAGIFEKKSDLVDDTITATTLESLKDVKEIKKIAAQFDFFMANAKLMPKVASVLGRYLGPMGKMPSPQLGIVPPGEDAASIKDVKDKIDKSVKVKPKEPSIKVAIGKSSMKDEEIVANINAVEAGVIKALPRGKENIRNILIKFTMTKPIKVD
ncbi:MAG: hypothetical protein KKF56_04505 [Nanoarchaeota archaeon]|nr:hypothetical protein [Nanoarchaeota archaeon]